MISTINPDKIKFIFNYITKILLNAERTVEALKTISLADPNYYTPNVLCP